MPCALIRTYTPAILSPSTSSRPLGRDGAYALRISRDGSGNNCTCATLILLPTGGFPMEPVRFSWKCWDIEITLIDAAPASCSAS
jgi:hypothetical protein